MDPLKEPSCLGQSGTGRELKIRLDRGLWQEMLDDVTRRAPAEEACGLLSGKINQDHYQALEVHPITNHLHSPSRYDMAPKEVVATFDKIEVQGHELVGIYHSHINGPLEPSETDIEMAYYPDCVYLIWSRLQNAWTCRAYLIQGGQFWQLPLIIDR